MLARCRFSVSPGLEFPALLPIHPGLVPSLLNRKSHDGQSTAHLFPREAEVRGPPEPHDSRAALGT